jgi:NTP pyrophosphatase (non-canonical NTP hydrolase)
MQLKEIMELQKSFDLKHEGSQPFYAKISDENLSELEHLLVCVLGEIGEAANITKKVVRGDFQLAEMKDSLSAELTDSFIYLIKICNQLDIDLEYWFIKKLEINRKRFKKYENS